MNLALYGTRISRAVGGQVEIVEADAAPRRFPTRSSNTLGICLKTGAAHEVTADGRRMAYPADAICVRMPRCVWSSESTVGMGFVSIDIDSSLLPDGIVSKPMSFCAAQRLPDLPTLVRDLRAGGARAEESVAEILNALGAAGVLVCSELEGADQSRVSRRVRDLLEDTIAAPPRIDALGAQIGLSRFALMRQFKRDYGVTPYAYVLRRRVEEAKRRIACGGDIAAVAHELGFADQAHLTRLFKRTVGITPGAYASSVRRTFVQDKDSGPAVP